MAKQPFIFSRPSDVEDTKETCIIRLANGERMRGCMRTVEYLHGWHSPNYPVPAMIGGVYYLPPTSILRYGEWIICDCDETFDPRLCIAVTERIVEADYPHDSPNYR